MRILLFLLCLQPALAFAAPRVVASIVPVYEVSAAVMDGIGSPELVIESHASAHHFAFKPSHIRLLQEADLVIWVDRHFEAGFGRIGEILPDSTAKLELLPALGDDDGHFWYAPGRLQRVVELVAESLSGLDPMNRRQYFANAQSLAGKIEDWRLRIARGWKDRPLRLLTDHGFLGPFASEFSAFEIESVHDHHDAHGGLKDLNRVEAWIEAGPVACLLTLESGPSRLASALIDKYRLQTVAITSSEASRTRGDGILLRLEGLESALDHCA